MRLRSSDFRPILRLSPAVALWCLLAPQTSSAQQPDRARAEALSRRASERIQALQREADKLTSEERTLLGDLRKLEIDRQIKFEEREQIAQQAAEVSAELDANAERTRELEAQETNSRPELRARLVDMYKLGQGRYLRLLLSTSDMRQVGQAARTLAALARIDHDRLVTRERMLKELKTVRGTLEDRQRKLNALRANAEHAELALAQAVVARNALIRDIDSRRDLNAQLVAELQTAQQKLQAILRDLSNGVVADAGSLPIRPFRGDLEWPVTATGNRRSTRAGTSGIGLEISTAEGAPVSAVHEGVVAFADTFGGFGNLVILEHGPQNFSLYANLLDMTVKKGERVERGEAIGTVGLAPAGSSELHFELRIDGQSVDPLQWLKKRP